MSDKNKDALDLDKLEALARAADTDVAACARFVTTFDPNGVLQLIALARRASQVSAAAPAEQRTLAGWFIYEGNCWVATSSDDPRATQLFRASEGQAHPDDQAVQAFADAMKAKMAISRAKGRSGWQECHAEDLRRMMTDHLAKGDPVDVGNFAMMLWNRGESTASEGQAQTSAAVEGWRHAANEWADTAYAGLQWLRNIEDGTTKSIKEARENMEDCCRHAKQVSDNVSRAAQLADSTGGVKS